MTLRYSTDIVIFGGGVAGLWVLNAVRSAGYQAILFEKGSLGGGQTLASQGIIHGGLKYALQGTLSSAAQAIADMPSRWRACLDGSGEMDLRGTRVLSDHYYMWSSGSLRSRLKTFLGSKSLRGRVEAVAPGSYPPFFQNASVRGSLYQLPDFVVDSESLVETLASKQKGAIFSLPDSGVSFEISDQKGDRVAVFTYHGRNISLSAKRFIFTAGEGNESLVKAARLLKAETQTRPLNMVYFKQRDLPQIYVHCIGDSFSLSPKLTVTSHQDVKGDTVWYLGGEIAESGVGKSENQQITAAKYAISKEFPWLDCASAEWRCFTINRAEANINDNHRPDNAYFLQDKNMIVAWPTKLTLTPALAEQILQSLKADKISPSTEAGDWISEADFEPARLGDSHWNLEKSA
ncbi:MAG: FAD-dependent oxidoreductase [Gammaproteobacteria bacterium]|nr:FAD-dependent oxidoreductase [Gammaproteobacteria bacterium]